MVPRGPNDAKTRHLGSLLVNTKKNRNIEKKTPYLGPKRRIGPVLSSRHRSTPKNPSRAVNTTNIDPKNQKLVQK